MFRMRNLRSLPNWSGARNAPSVNLARFMCLSFGRSDSLSAWRRSVGAGQQVSGFSASLRPPSHSRDRKSEACAISTSTESHVYTTYFGEYRRISIIRLLQRSVCRRCRYAARSAERHCFELRQRPNACWSCDSTMALLPDKGDTDV
jgi:hypothetical protein